MFDERDEPWLGWKVEACVPDPHSPERGPLVIQGDLLEQRPTQHESIHVPQHVVEEDSLFFQVSVFCLFVFVMLNPYSCLSARQAFGHIWPKSDGHLIWWHFG